MIDTIANQEINPFTYDETPADITGGSFGPNVIAISPDGTTRTSAGTAKTP